MAPHLWCVFSAAILFTVASNIRSVASQIVGCDAPGVICPTKQTGSKDSGICTYNDRGIGVVSFDSSNTSDGPLTWIVKGGERKGYQYKSFYLGTPPELNLLDVTTFNGCSMAFFNMPDALQLPLPSNDFGQFGCHRVMGQWCSQDVLAQARREVLSLDQPRPDDRAGLEPCSVLANRLGQLLPPELFKGRQYGATTPTSRFPKLILAETNPNLLPPSTRLDWK
jgi:hypothetical protein